MCLLPRVGSTECKKERNSNTRKTTEPRVGVTQNFPKPSLCTLLFNKGALNLLTLLKDLVCYWYLVLFFRQPPLNFHYDLGVYRCESTLLFHERKGTEVKRERERQREFTIRITALSLINKRRRIHKKEGLMTEKKL